MQLHGSACCRIFSLLGDRMHGNGEAEDCRFSLNREKQAGEKASGRLQVEALLAQSSCCPGLLTWRLIIPSCWVWQGFRRPCVRRPEDQLWEGYVPCFCSVFVSAHCFVVFWLVCLWLALCCIELTGIRVLFPDRVIHVLDGCVGVRKIGK